MKKLNITKEQFNKSKYFQRKYGKLEYVSESGRYFKTDKGKVLKFVKEYVDSGARPLRHRDDGACANLKPGEYCLQKEWDEGMGTRLCLYKCLGEYSRRCLRAFLPREKKLAEYCLKGLQDGSIKEENLKYVTQTAEGKVLKFKESTRRQFNEGLDYVGSTEHSVTLCNDCPFCGEHYEFTLDMDFDEFMDSMWKYKSGELLQNAFPNLSPDEREQIKTGICSTCWDAL